MRRESSFTIGRYFPAPDLGLSGQSTGPMDAQRCGNLARNSLQQDRAREIELIEALNDALRDELTCVLRYMGHGVVARRLALPEVAERFLRYASEASVHARRLMERIVQLGGVPDTATESIAWRSAAVLDDTTDLREMIRSSLSAEGDAVDIYCRILNLISGRDLSTQHLVEDIMIEELQQAEELWEWKRDDTAPAD